MCGRVVYIGWKTLKKLKQISDLVETPKKIVRLHSLLPRCIRPQRNILCNKAAEGRITPKAEWFSEDYTQASVRLQRLLFAASTRRKPGRHGAGVLLTVEARLKPLNKTAFSQFLRRAGDVCDLVILSRPYATFFLFPSSSLELISQTCPGKATWITWWVMAAARTQPLLVIRTPNTSGHLMPAVPFPT